MKGILKEAVEMHNETSLQLCSELANYKEQGIKVTVSGYQASINKRLTDMLLRDGPCTYMRSYSLMRWGKLQGLSFSV